jgi:hypothetical protein
LKADSVLKRLDRALPENGKGVTSSLAGTLEDVRNHAREAEQRAESSAQSAKNAEEKVIKLEKRNVFVTILTICIGLGGMFFGLFSVIDIAQSVRVNVIRDVVKGQVEATLDPAIQDLKASQAALEEQAVDLSDELVSYELGSQMQSERIEHLQLALEKANNGEQQAMQGAMEELTERVEMLERD